MPRRRANDNRRTRFVGVAIGFALLPMLALALWTLVPVVPMPWSPIR